MAGDRTPNGALAEVIAESGATYYALAREIRSVAAEAGQRLSTGPSAVAYKEIQAAAARYRKRGVAGAAGLNQRATDLLSNQA
ncbi:hypothetical protein ACFY0G_12780 [Streptomyces sp. NPDC001552]|uniref:hypothetical protein n=1 Tax=Streptomyces sp. NPDC001552 TaxID=3364587 RepID=UPI003692ADE2